jgi:hypothetical protein
MLNIKVEKTPGSTFRIEPMSIKRDWMDLTPENHAYRCFPVTQSNVIGWSLSSTSDIVFKWDGINDSSPNHVEIFSPQEGSYSGRGQSSVSLDTGLIFRTDSDFSIWTINPVNYFNDEFETISSLISTSFYGNPLPLAIKAKKANEVVTIKAGTSLATIIPISLTNLNNSTIDIVMYEDFDGKKQEASKAYGDASQALNASGQWTDWYRNAVNEKGESLGSHEVKTLKLGVNDITNGDIM